MSIDVIVKAVSVKISLADGRPGFVRVSKTNTGYAVKVNFAASKISFDLHLGFETTTLMINEKVGFSVKFDEPNFSGCLLKKKLEDGREYLDFFFSRYGSAVILVSDFEEAIKRINAIPWKLE